MPLELTTEEAPEYFSATRLNSYMMCPNKYLFNYIEKRRRETMPAPMIFGSAVHKTIEQVYGRLKGGGEPMGVEEVKDAAAGEWMAQVERAYNESDSGTQFSEKESESKLKDRIVALMSLFVEKFDMPDEVHTVEQRFRSWIIDPKTGRRRDTQLMGFVDAIVSRDGHQIIEEHKTASRRWSRHDHEHSLQASLYLAAHSFIGLRFNVLVQRANPCIEVFNVKSSQWHQEDAVNAMCRVLDAIKGNHFYPRRGWQCDRCSFRRRCYEGT